MPIDQNLFQLDGGNNASDQEGSYAGYTASSGFMGAGLGGSPSGVMPTPSRFGRAPKRHSRGGL